VRNASCSSSRSARRGRRACARPGRRIAPARSPSGTAPRRPAALLSLWPINKQNAAVYPDKAVSQACITCHSEHKDSPKSDFKVGDTMGGVLVRIPLKG
jgi:hypothetical protein